jgi:small conductance mechanosensitive channel
MLEDTTPTFAVGEFADSAVKLYCRFWVESKNYWDAYFYMLENVKLAFDKEGITIPFNQLDVHIDK